MFSHHLGNFGIIYISFTAWIEDSVRSSPTVVHCNHSQSLNWTGPKGPGVGYPKITSVIDPHFQWMVNVWNPWNSPKPPSKSSNPSALIRPVTRCGWTWCSSRCAPWFVSGWHRWSSSSRPSKKRLFEGPRIQWMIDVRENLEETAHFTAVFQGLRGFLFSLSLQHPPFQGIREPNYERHSWCTIDLLNGQL